MRNLTPTPAGARAPLPAFAPVPRRCARHDGWTPERQRAFVEALADTGSVSRAAAMVNMSTEGAYYLRRQPGAEGFRAAWSAALDFGVARLKDIAFDRATQGTLVPVITGGRLIGYRRIFNDRLLMFCLRHYGEDANGKRTTVNYFSTKASAGAGDGATNAEASTTTVRTIITGPAPGAPATLDDSAARLDDFPAVPLDDAARAEIARALDACAARHREVQGGPDDPAEHFFAVEQPERRTAIYEPGYKKPRFEMLRPPPAGDLIVPADAFLDPVFAQPPEATYSASEEERPWQLLDRPEEMDRIDAVAAEIKANDAQRRTDLIEETTKAGPLPHEPPPPPKPRRKGPRP